MLSSLSDLRRNGKCMRGHCIIVGNGHLWRNNYTYLVQVQVQSCSCKLLNLIRSNGSCGCLSMRNLMIIAVIILTLMHIQFSCYFYCCASKKFNLDSILLVQTHIDRIIPSLPSPVNFLSGTWHNPRHSTHTRTRRWNSWQVRQVYLHCSKPCHAIMSSIKSVSWACFQSSNSRSVSA